MRRDLITPFTLAVCAGLAHHLGKIFQGALPGHLHQAELGDLEDVDPAFILLDGLLQEPDRLVPVLSPSPCR